MIQHCNSLYLHHSHNLYKNKQAETFYKVLTICTLGITCCSDRHRCDIFDNIKEAAPHTLLLCD